MESPTDFVGNATCPNEFILLSVAALHCINRNVCLIRLGNALADLTSIPSKPMAPDYCDEISLLCCHVYMAAIEYG